MQNIKGVEHSRYIYQNELDKTFFQFGNGLWIGDFKDLTRNTASNKILRDKAFDNAKIPKYHGYQRDLACMVYKFFDKKISGKTIKSEVISNKESAEELHKPIIRTFKKQRVY